MNSIQNATSNVFRPIAVLTAALLIVFVPSYYVYSFQSYKAQSREATSKLNDEVDRKDEEIQRLAKELDTAWYELSQAAERYRAVSDKERERIDSNPVIGCPIVHSLVRRETTESISAWIMRVKKQLADDGVATYGQASKREEVPEQRT